MDLQLFNDTINPIKDKLYRFSLRYVKNPMEAEDVVQEVFIKLWKNRDQIDQIKNIEAWCMRVTRNLSIDKLRAAHNRLKQMPEGMEWTDPNVSPQRQTELNETMAKVKQWIEELPEAQPIAATHSESRKVATPQGTKEMLNAIQRHESNRAH